MRARRSQLAVSRDPFDGNHIQPEQCGVNEAS